MTLNTVAAANLQAAATQEGASSRVITAISNNGGSATYLAYGWSADPATVYEVKVTTAAPGGSQDKLMQQGYAIVDVIFDLTQTNPYTYLGER